MNRIIFFFILLLYLRLLLYSSSLLSVRLFFRPYHVRSVLLFGLSLKPLPKLVSGFIFVVGLLFLTETKFFSLRGNDQLLVSTRTELRVRSSSYLLTIRRRNFFPPSGPIGYWLSCLFSPTEARYTPVELNKFFPRDLVGLLTVSSPACLVTGVSHHGRVLSPACLNSTICHLRNLSWV